MSCRVGRRCPRYLASSSKTNVAILAPLRVDLCLFFCYQLYGTCELLGPHAKLFYGTQRLLN